MAQEEKTDRRNKSYSEWHRRNSTRRFIGIEAAQLLAMIDLDASLWVEYDDGTKETVALIETAIDTGQPYKNATVTLNLAKRANVPCYVVLYTLSDKPNPANPTCRDIDSFRVKRLYPEPMDYDWRILTPTQWAQALVKIRQWGARQIDKTPHLQDTRVTYVVR